MHSALKIFVCGFQASNGLHILDANTLHVLRPSRVDIAVLFFYRVKCSNFPFTFVQVLTGGTTKLNTGFYL